MISSRSNERVKTIRGLRSCKGEFAFLEGPHLVEEMLATGLRPKEVVATPDFLARPAGRALQERLGQSLLVVTDSVLDCLTDARTPQGVVAVLELERSGVELLPVVAGGVYLFLDRVQDPGNLGALIRSAEATRVAGVALSPGCAHPNHPKALRASSGSLLRVPVSVQGEPEALFAHLAEIQPTVAALVPTGGDDLYEASLEGSVVLLIGSEGAGLADELTAAAQRRVTIPLEDPVESLNVTVATSIVLHELSRRRRATDRRKEEP